MITNQRKSWRSYLVFFFISLLASLTLIPFNKIAIQQQMVMFNIDQNDIPIDLLAYLSLLNPLFLVAVAILLGNLLSTKVNLFSYIHTKDKFGTLKNTPLLPLIKSGLIGGLIVGGVILITDIIVFSDELTPNLSFSSEITPFINFLMSVFYGGIVEELMMRWGLMTLIVWLLWKLTSKRNSQPSPAIYWIAIIGSAFIFSLAHFGSTAVSGTISFLIIFRMIILNTFGGILFGWLYWKKGLESAIVAHMTANTLIFILTLLFV
ncbi:CPBP family intramembrane glutamic endopeptidase [Alkalicoccobacillus gibsonii]|uniref:CPBP family intramembrane glutamic endopeptidase n=1 Tax=Alkalicoccobacillus gibsonii TaxID=79881 RepID=UPI003F7B5948